MRRKFVIEAVMMAIYGQLMAPSRSVEYLIPYSTVAELYELKESADPVMPNADEDRHVRKIMGDLISFFEDPFNRKKLERALSVPWKSSPPIPVNDRVTLIVVNALEDLQYGESFDPVETELILTAQREEAPVLTDQVEFQEKIVEQGVEIQVFDIDDFEYAVEEGFILTDGETL